MLAITSRTLAARMAPMRLARGFGTSSARQNAASGISVSPLPPRKPIGALRGGLFGFFLGTTAAGAGVYYYAVQEYKASNELLTEDIYVRLCI
ncbi:uncharacterized protein CTHT_0067350 [Thermochaetoides thermophila DSM 1495]|uniref:Uncharacterized protein n=1 Tax=Chaetomium thermophilum (strain DSM 1495 / CBS 144.50 / IMI 039719) TaxID=759272 RepID=G0SGS1_CHATD|nr:hypothetical protein CTHT_0067350 [Thermochaetoides thermophila DSM 1495]EGS17410.1 hypothetical protein CTHT_0067350 [Thermochaetoides thermophila DSM 1495]